MSAWWKPPCKEWQCCACGVKNFWGGKRHRDGCRSCKSAGPQWNEQQSCRVNPDKWCGSKLPQPRVEKGVKRAALHETPDLKAVEEALNALGESGGCEDIRKALLDAKQQALEAAKAKEEPPIGAQYDCVRAEITRMQYQKDKIKNEAQWLREKVQKKDAKVEALREAIAEKTVEAAQLMEQVMCSREVPRTVLLSDTVSGLMTDLANGKLNVEEAKGRAAAILEIADSGEEHVAAPRPRDPHRSSESGSDTSPSPPPKRCRDTGGSGLKKKEAVVDTATASASSRADRGREKKARSMSPVRNLRSRSRAKGETPKEEQK